MPLPHFTSSSSSSLCFLQHLSKTVQSPKVANLPRCPSARPIFSPSSQLLPAPSYQSQCFLIAIDQGVLILPGSLDLATHVWPQVWPMSRLQDRAPGWRPESAHRARSISNSVGVSPALPRRPGYISNVARGSDTLHPTLII